MIKKLFIGLLVIVTSLLYGCVKDLHNSGISESTVLKGRVLEESEREPLVNIIVTVTNGTSDYANTKTNNEGRFELTVNYDNFDGGNYLFLNSGSSGITKRIDLKGMGQETYDYGDIFLYNKNDGATPTITTSAVKDITSNGAVCGGNITSDGGSEVTRRGLCWSLSENPTISDSNVSCESGTGEFTGAITGLTPNTTYHVRAFATNAIGTSYGEDRHFTTANGGGNATKPTVSTKAISTISTNSAECGGDVTSDGGSTVTERGLCWAKASITHNPTISNYSVQDNGVGTGSFTCTMTNLTANTDYYVRAYAKNAVDIAYGDPVPFTTLSSGGNSAPSVTTGNYSNVTSSSATCYGNVTSDGGAGISYRGICWSTSPNPTIPHAPWGQTPEPNGTEYIYEGGQVTGTFSCELTNLLPNTKYYYRAFAGNSVDETYGDDRWFITLASNTYPPEVTTWTVEYNSSNNTATCKGIITAEGGAPVNSCGICWGTSQNVTIVNNPNVVYGNLPGSSGMYTCTISGLVFGTTYYVRAFATNSFSTGYGQPKPLVIPGGGGGGSAPSAPTGVSATVSGSRIIVSWNSISNADEYTVYWSNDGNTYSDIGTTSNLYFYDDVPYENNYYKVKAKNSYGESPFSSPAYCPYSNGGGGGGGQTYTYTFESSWQDWTTIDADGDGETWKRFYSNNGNIGHNNSVYTMGSESYINNYGPLTPDNYLVSPQKYTVSNGARISFYVCAMDADYPAEHYGVAVSTASNPTANSFVVIWEENLSAKHKSGDKVRGNRAQGTWYLKTIDLSAYSGQSIWIALRHFNCTDEFVIVIDDITIVTGNRSFEGLDKGRK